MQFSQHFFQPQVAQAAVAVKCEMNSPKKVNPVVSWLEGRMQRCTTGGCLKTTEIRLSFNMCFCKSLFNTSRLNMLSNISSDMFMAKMYLYKLYTARNQLGVLVSLHLQHPLSQVKLGCIAGCMTKMVCIAVFHFNPLYIYSDCKYI